MILYSFDYHKIQRDHEQVKELFKLADQNGFVIAGGYARYVCSQREDPIMYGDIDFFPKKESVNIFKFEQILRGMGFIEIKRTSMSISYQKLDLFGNSPIIQIVLPLFSELGRKTFGLPENLITNFDFTISSFALISETECCSIGGAMADELNLELVPLSPFQSLNGVFGRAIKYANKGYHMSQRNIDYICGNYKAGKDFFYELCRDDFK